MVTVQITKWKLCQLIEYVSVTYQYAYVNCNCICIVHLIKFLLKLYIYLPITDSQMYFNFIRSCQCFADFQFAKFYWWMMINSIEFHEYNAYCHKLVLVDNQNKFLAFTDGQKLYALFDRHNELIESTSFNWFCSFMLLPNIFDK